MTAILQALGLVKSFGPTPALQGADLTIDAGEIVAVMGPSGSGKSTLLHCLAGIVTPDSGSVRFGDHELTAMSDHRRSELRRQEFGFVFQFGQLLSELTCLENVALPLRLEGLRRKAAQVAAREWLTRLGVADVADLSPGLVSGGQAQRVAVARALIGAPAVVFADEPTGALDTLTGEKVMDLLTAAVRDLDAALIIVTHEPRVAAWSDREVVVRDGRVGLLAGATS